MSLKEADDNQLIEEMANRGVDVRTIKGFSTKELSEELEKRADITVHEVPFRGQAILAIQDWKNRSESNIYMSDGPCIILIKD